MPLPDTGVNLSALPVATSPDAIDLTGVQGGVTKKLSSTLLATQAELDAHAHTGTYGLVPSAAEKVVYVSPNGLDANDGRTPGSPKLTFAAALAAIGTGNLGHIEMGVGVIGMGAGVSLSGYKVTFSGKGEATILRAAGQTGPVLDFVGYAYPDSMRWRRRIGNFAVEGDNTAGTAKVGIRFGTAAVGLAGMTFHDISVSNTGGACFDFSGSQLNDFYNLIANTPVSANANDVPYMKAVGACNGNRFIGCGLRSVLATVDTGAGGAIRFEDDGTAYAPIFNQFIGCWHEYLHLPTNGTVIHLEGSTNTIVDWQHFDASKVSGATGTSWLRLANAAFENNGGNTVRGMIPGTQGGTSFDVGVEISQSGNHIEGIKGFNGSNVQLNAGVNRTYVLLGGYDSSASNAAFIDNSGTVTNVLIDAGEGEWEMVKGKLVTSDFYLGSTVSGPRFFQSSGQLTVRANTTTFQTAAGSERLQADQFEGVRVINGPLKVSTATHGLMVKEGTNAKQGVATLVAGAVTVACTTVTANSRILLTVQSLGTVTAPKAIAVTARTAGTSFTITSADATDTSVVAYEIFEPA